MNCKQGLFTSSRTFIALVASVVILALSSVSQASATNIAPNDTANLVHSTNTKSDTSSLNTANIRGLTSKQSQESLMTLTNDASKSHHSLPSNAVLSADRCTAIAVGKLGSALGHTMTTHNSGELWEFDIYVINGCSTIRLFYLLINAWMYSYIIIIIIIIIINTYLCYQLSTLNLHIHIHIY
jgi:hypothetical protein